MRMNSIDFILLYVVGLVPVVAQLSATVAIKLAAVKLAAAHVVFATNLILPVMILLL